MTVLIRPPPFEISYHGKSGKGVGVDGKALRGTTSPSSSLTLDATSPGRGSLWHSVTFSSKPQSVSSKTKPLCQGLPCQGSCQANARLRGCTKDAFRSSGINAGAAKYNLSVIFAGARCHLPWQGRPWQTAKFLQDALRSSTLCERLWQTVKFSAKNACIPARHAV